MTEIEYSEDQLSCTIKSNKMLSSIRVRKEEGGYSFFVISMEQGKLPEDLSGRYSTLAAGVKAVQQYLKNKVKTKAVQRNEYADKREKQRNASNLQSESSK